ncbi:MAG TPA: hypothetical protein VFA12_10150 [Stellaceae bacterium]|nr:hypothetical protein [Stellaceae bacterium]
MTKHTISGQFVHLPRSLLESAAWRELAINTRRFLDFLMIEHLRRGRKANGNLVAPRAQLEAFGIGARHISAAIEEAERLGLVDVKRGTGRRANRYALTWLPLFDGSAPSNRWKMTSEGKSLLMTSLLQRNSFRREVTRPVATSQGKSLQGLPKGSTYLEYSTRGE